MINLYQLQIFVMVADRGSFSSAAEQLNLTQPGVSQHIKSLEETYKVRLFNRNGPHIDLTEAGLRLLEIARPLIKQATYLEETFSGELGEIRGNITIIYSHSASAQAAYYLPALLADFQNRFPQVKFMLSQTTEDNLAAQLNSREAHFALQITPPRQKSLESKLLMQDELVLVLPPNHAWHNQQIEIKKLANQPFLLRLAGSETRRHAETLLRGAGLSFNDLKIVAELDTAEALIMSAAAGLGLGFVNSVHIRQFLAARLVGFARLNLKEVDKEAAPPRPERPEAKTPPTGKPALNSAELYRKVYLSRLSGASLTERPPGQERFWEFIQSLSLATIVPVSPG